MSQGSQEQTPGSSVLAPIANTQQLTNLSLNYLQASMFNNQATNSVNTQQISNLNNNQQQAAPLAILNCN